MLKSILRIPSQLLILLVRGYQLFISPWLPPACRYTPTCSQYAILALRKYGFFKGVILASYRILRCNPWGGHGHDPPRWFGEAPAAPIETPLESPVPETADAAIEVIDTETSKPETS